MAEVAVVLHVYDLGTSPGILNINKVSYAIGGGLYHTAVEVYDKEYSFGYAEQGSGVFGCLPTKCNLHQYKEAVSLGQTSLNVDEVKQILREMALDYQAQTYELLTRNCHTFCQDFAKALGVDPLPGWITRFPKIGSTTVNAVNATKEKAREVDERFEISQKAEVIKKNVTTGIMSAWSQAQAGWTVATSKTKEFEAKHHLKDKAVMGAFKSMNFVNKSFDKICGNPNFEEVEGLDKRNQERSPSQGGDETNPLMSDTDTTEGESAEDLSTDTPSSSNKLEPTATPSPL